METKGSLGPHGGQVEVEARGVVGGNWCFRDWTPIILSPWANGCRIIEIEWGDCIAAQNLELERSMSSGKSSARDRALGTQ
jgi:hypothetical protein